MNDAISLLKADHKKVKGLFKEASELGDGAHAARAKLFLQIDHELTVHTQVEEAIFYSAFKSRSKPGTDERDEVLEAYEEHGAAKDLIKKLEGTDPSDETYKAKLTLLGEMIDAHVNMEESEMFPQAQELLGSDELKRLGERITAAKKAAAAV